METEGVQVAILTRPETIYYVTGYSATWIANRTAVFHGVIVPREGEPRIICRALESKATKEQWTRDPILYSDQEGPWKGLSKMLSETLRSGSKVGIEKRSLSLWQFEKIREILNDVEFRDLSSQIVALISSPSQKETEYLRKAGEITQKGFEAAIDAVKKGASISDIVAEAEHAVYKAGQPDQNREKCLVWAGPTGGAMHSMDISGKVSDGDLVTIEIWATYKQYYAGAQGTLYVGNSPSQELVKMYDMVSKMYVAAKDAVRPFSTSGSVFDEASKVYRASYGEDYYRRIGGSVGLIGFGVNLAKDDKAILKPGVGLLIQPQTNEPILVTVSATVVVTENGCEEICRPLLELTKV